jgi:hypothetical protein
MNSAVSIHTHIAPVPSHMRSNGWLLIATFFLWVLTFLLLSPLLGGDGPPPTPMTAAEAVQQTEGVRFGNVLIIVIGNVAMLVGIVPLIRMGRRLTAPKVALWARLGIVAAVVAVCLMWFHSYLRGGLSFAYPPYYPPLVDRVELYATNWISSVGVDFWTVAVVLVSVSLARHAILRRTGWIVAGLGVILLVLMLVINFGIPFVPAFLSMILGIGLLRRQG